MHGLQSVYTSSFQDTKKKKKKSHHCDFLMQANSAKYNKLCFCHQSDELIVQPRNVSLLQVALLLYNAATTKKNLGICVLESGSYLPLFSLCCAPWYPQIKHYYIISVVQCNLFILDNTILTHSKDITDHLCPTGVNATKMY